MSRALIASACLGLVACASSVSGRAARRPALEIVSAPTIHETPPQEARPSAGSSRAPAVDIDPTLPAVEHASVLGRDAGGRTLVAIMGMAEVETPFGRGLGTYDYYAVLAADSLCIEETHRFDQLHAASATGTIDEATSILSSSDAAAERERLRVLARRFGLGQLGGLVVGLQMDTFVLVANNQLYTIENGVVQHVQGGHAVLHALSPDDRSVSFGQCIPPCRGRYVPAVLDVVSGTVRTFPSANALDSFWALDGSVYFVVDDRRSFRDRTTQVCITRLAADGRRPRRTACFPANERAGLAVSPNAQFVSLRGMRTIRVFEIPSGGLRYEVAAHAIFLDMDDRGRVVFDFAGTVQLHTPSSQQSLPQRASAGFLPDGSVLVFQRAMSGDTDRGVIPLRDHACSSFEVWSPPGAP